MKIRHPWVRIAPFQLHKSTDPQNEELTTAADVTFGWPAQGYMAEATPVISGNWMTIRFQVETGEYHNRRWIFRRVGDRMEALPDGWTQEDIDLLRKRLADFMKLAASLNSSYRCMWLLKYEAHPTVRRCLAGFTRRIARFTLPPPCGKSNGRVTPLRVPTSVVESCPRVFSLCATTVWCAFARHESRRRAEYYNARLSIRSNHEAVAP